MVSHPNRSEPLTKHQKRAIAVLNPWSETEAAFRAAFEPARHGAVTRTEAETLVWAVFQMVRREDFRVAQILAELFPGGES